MTGRGFFSWERLTIAVYLLCFGYGALAHAADFWRFGWWPYDFGPPFANFFWNWLVLLDATVVVLLLLGRRREGLVLALLVIASDVIINAYVWLALDLGDFRIALPLQASLPGFVLGSLPFLWPKRMDKHRRSMKRGL